MVFQDYSVKRTFLADLLSTKYEDVVLYLCLLKEKQFSNMSGFLW